MTAKSHLPPLAHSLYADSTKAKTELGWKVKFPSIEPIVATAWKWHSAHPEGFGKK